MAPVIDPYYSLVYSGSARNVATVIVGGEILVEDGRHRRVDVAEVVAAADRAGRSMHERLEKIIAEGQENQADVNRKG
jgi:5-methylthioadenosine/S-adenosylhomocysteine deaminase